MAKALLRRVILMIPTLLIISVLSFVIMQLPPGDYLTTYLMQLETSGRVVDRSEITALRQRYGLDQPLHVQYLKWMAGLLRGDLGYSFEWEQPVRQLIGERLVLTVVITLFALLFSWVVAFLIGVYSAVRHNTLGDYLFSLGGFLGLSTPDFMLALVVMYAGLKLLGVSPGGLFSPAYVDAPWSWGKVVDLVNHMWIPMIIIAASGTASLIRIMRNNLLDELKKAYVVTARAKGLRESRVIFRYPVRVALNPFVSVIGWQLPRLISGSVVVSMVLSLPTIGPLQLRALVSQDMYLAGSILLLSAVLTVIGTLVSDVLLVMIDPRIRLE